MCLWCCVAVTCKTTKNMPKKTKQDLNRHFAFISHLQTSCDEMTFEDIRQIKLPYQWTSKVIDRIGFSCLLEHKVVIVKRSAYTNKRVIVVQTREWFVHVAYILALITFFAHFEIYSMLISQIRHSSYNLGKWTITCLQSSPSQRHAALQVVSPPDTTASPHLHMVNFPASAQPDHFVFRTATVKWDVEHVRRCPVIVRVNDVFTASGTHLWMTSPDIQQLC